MTHHPSAASLRLHGARLLFPPVATLLFLVLTEYIARGALSGDTFVQYIFPHPEAYLLAWGLLFLVWMAVDWLTRFAPLATLLSALLGCLPATVDFYILQLRGEPFLPWDLMQVSEAAGVASAAGIHVQKSMVVSGVVVLALTVGSFFLYRGRQKLPWVQRLAGFAASTAATCALIFGVFLQPAVTQSLGILPDAWMQDRYYRYYGVITSFLTNLTNLEIDKPEDYSEEAINAILDNVEAGEKYTTSPAWPGSYAAQTPADEQVKQPTILYVMDESYWDVSELEQYGFQFDTDVSANLHALQQTSAYGRVYSPSFGGGTCDVEFEALTGYSVSYLPSGSKPYQQHVTKPMFALPSYLKTEGYQTAAVHCFWARYWSRDTAYPNLGLDDFISLEKMHGVQKVRRHYWTTGLVTDDSMADQIIGQYETMKAQSDAPVFLHAVTMQNHTNYNKDNYPDDQRVKVTEAPAAMRTHDDQISAHAFDGAHDAVVYRMTFAHHRIDGDTGFFHCFFGGFQSRVGFRCGSTQVLRLAIGKISAHAGERIRIDHIQHRHRAAQALGQLSCAGNRKHRGGRAIHWHQNIFEHQFFSLNNLKQARDLQKRMARATAHSLPA